MSGQTPTSDNFWPLLNAACDGTLAETQAEELAAMLDSDSAAREVFLNHVQLRRNIRLLGRTERVRDLGIARVQETLPLDPHAEIGVLTTAFSSPVGYLSSGWPVAYLIAGVICGLGLLIGSFTYVCQPVPVAVRPHSAGRGTTTPDLPRDSVGWVTGMVDCQFAQGTVAPANGVGIPLGRKYTLLSGLMEITYGTGAKVILQGPVTYEVESVAGGYLFVGKLTAKLEKKSEVRSQKSEVRGQRAESANQKSEIRDRTFTVRTPTATVTDLGTEFGVAVGKEGHTTSRVFRGSVEVRVVDRAGKADGGVQVLHEGETAIVENGGTQSDGNHVAMLAPSAKPVDFVRAIPKRTVKALDLVDVVAGGDGFSGRRNQGVEPSSGRLMDRLPKSTKPFHLAGDGAYHRVDESSLIDGVFIPNGGAGPVQIDSAGDVFDKFPPTDNRTYGYIWAGSVKPSHYAPGCNALGGINYSSSGHGLLDMLSNKGITFDLEAIRKASPGCKLLRFRAVVGNTAPASAQETFELSDVWVLVDGKVRFSRQKLRGWQGAIPIVVPIADKDRFLTLATTDGGDGHAWDWLVFGDPQLDMQETAEIGGKVQAARPSAPATSRRSDSREPRLVQTSFDANADMIENQTGGAPSPTYDNWSVGYRLLAGDGEGLSGTNLHPFTGAQHLACDESPVRGWESSAVSMGVMVNTRGEEYRNVNGVAFEKDVICMHPGNDGSSAVLRWTAPRNGVVKTSTVFSAIHEPVTDVHLLLVHDGVVKSLFSGEINNKSTPKITRLDASQSAVAVSAGDYIEVVVGWGSNQSNWRGSTGVLHSITYTSSRDVR